MLQDVEKEKYVTYNRTNLEPAYFYLCTHSAACGVVCLQAVKDKIGKSVWLTKSSQTKGLFLHIEVYSGNSANVVDDDDDNVVMILMAVVLVLVKTMMIIKQT